MRRFLSFISCVIFPLIGMGAVYTPQSVPDPKDKGQWEYVANPDDILQAEDVRFLNTCAKALEDSTGVELCVVAIGNIGDMDMFDFCYQLFQTWGIGGKGKNTGVLVCFVLDSHDIRIMTGTGIEGVMTDAMCNRIVQDEMIPLFREEQYGKGLCYGAMRIYEVCTDGEAPEELRNMQSVTDRAGYDRATDEDMSAAGALIVFCLFVVGVIGLLVLLSLLVGYKRCPVCGKRKCRAVKEQVVKAATYAAAGSGVRTYKCKHCGHTYITSFIIPRRQRTTYVGGTGRGGGFSGGGFGGGFGGLWGGGSTSGGGAGGKW